MTTPRDLSSILATLAAGKVEFVLVGALAAVAQGAPVTTHDVDIVHARTDENLDRLIAVLTGLHARYRRPGAPVRPDRSALATEGHSLFVTDLGPLDCLGTIESGLAYEDLLPLSTGIQVDGHPLRVLNLETIVELKRRSSQAKDKLILPVLEATLASVRRGLRQV